MTYKVSLKLEHDNGIVVVGTTGESIDSCIETILKSERAPRSSIKDVRVQILNKI